MRCGTKFLTFVKKLNMYRLKISKFVYDYIIQELPYTTGQRARSVASLDSLKLGQ